MYNLMFCEFKMIKASKFLYPLPHTLMFPVVCVIFKSTLSNSQVCHTLYVTRVNGYWHDRSRIPLSCLTELENKNVSLSIVSQPLDSKEQGRNAWSLVALVPI